jgi:hypothetical protein
MPRLAWAVPCRRGIVDKFTSLVTLVETIDEARMRTETNRGDDVTLDLCLVTNWAREDFAIPERGGFCRCSIVSPDGEAERPLVLDVKLDEFLRVRNVFRYPRMAYKGLGEYRFRIEWLDEKDQEAGRLATEVPFWVQRLEEHKSEEEPSPS